ncbi:MAG: hypothetical protein PHP57_11090 [Sideroxydans sp.]|nr:hypothetical protein [Sideroxydans sp.]
MLDNATLALLAKLKILTRKMEGNIDIMKLSEDKQYATHTLKELSNADDPDLVMVVLQLMNLYGMLDIVSSTAKPAEKKNVERYVGALR